MKLSDKLYDDKHTAIGGVAEKEGDKFKIVGIHNLGLGHEKAIKKWAKGNWEKWKWLEKYGIII